MLQKLFWEQKISPVLKPVVGSKSESQCELIIEHIGMKVDRIANFVQANQGEICKEIKIIPAMTVKLPVAAISELAGFQHIQRIWVDTKVRVMADKDIPGLRGALNEEYDYTGKGVTIAILDTGIYPHGDLIAPVNRLLAWNDLVGKNPIPHDDHGHGTHVAGIIAGNGRESQGKYKGVAPDARLVGVKVLDENGTGKLSDLILGIQWCLDNLATLKIKIINLSLGTRSQGNYREDPLCRVTSAAWRNGVIICSTAGKTGVGCEAFNTPGINPNIIKVGNMDFEKTLSSEDVRLKDGHIEGSAFSNYIIPDLVASGSGVVSLKPDGGYCNYLGASMATSTVSGAIALILEKWPFCRPNQVKFLLTRKAGDSGLGTNLQGAGVLDLEKVLGKRHKKKPVNNLLSLALKTALNFTGINSPGNQPVLNDILMLALTLLNGFLNKKPTQLTQNN